MPIYDGIVTVDDHEVPVIVEIDGDQIRMSAGGREVGTWSADECEISHVTESRYAISAEDEILEFVPNQPSLFAAVVDRGREHTVTTAPVIEDPEPEKVEDKPSVAEAPPPKPLTMGLFYGLCFITAVLACWALISFFL